MERETRIGDVRVSLAAQKTQGSAIPTRELSSSNKKWRQFFHTTCEQQSELIET